MELKSARSNGLAQSVSDFYLKGARFVFRPGHRLSPGSDNVFFFNNKQVLRHAASFHIFQFLMFWSLYHSTLYPLSY